MNLDDLWKACERIGNTLLPPPKRTLICHPDDEQRVREAVAKLPHADRITITSDVFALPGEVIIVTPQVLTPEWHVWTDLGFDLTVRDPSDPLR